MGPSRNRNPPAYLIGDFKRQVSSVDPRENQWFAIMNYAQSSLLFNSAGNPGHQYIPIALYVTLFTGRRNEKENLK